jgi:hypothetical protein
MFSFSYNKFVFQKSDFINYMISSGITCWEITQK